MKKRDVLNSPKLLELKKKRNTATRNRVLLYVMILVLLLTGLSLLSRWEKLNIANVEVEGNNIIDKEVIEKIVRAEISGKYLWIFPKSNFLIYPRNKIKEELAHDLPRLKDTSLKLSNIKTIQISTSERSPSYMWCGDELTSENFEAKNNNCYFMDDIGYIFDLAPYFSGEVYFKFFGEVEKIDELPLGAKFLPNDLARILSFKNDLNLIGVKPAAFYINKNDDSEFYLSSNISPPNSPKIIFKMEDNFEQLIENLKTALATEPLKTDFIKKYSQLVYLDLRFGENKVYFKFK